LLGTTIQNTVVQVTRCPAVVHPWSNVKDCILLCMEIIAVCKESRGQCWKSSQNFETRRYPKHIVFTL